MNRYVLDSNALNHLVYRRHGVDERARAALKAGDVLGTGIPVVAEILAGVFASDTRGKNQPIVERKLRKLRFWPFDLAAAREYARLYAEMRKKGDHVQPIDLMVAAIAMNLRNGIVVTSDSDFERVSGLTVENWAN